MKLEYLGEVSRVLNKCGAVQFPDGVTALPLPRGYIMPMVIDPGKSYTFTKEISGESPWMLRSISSDTASNSLTNIRCQIQLPNGRFLFGGNGIDVGQFAWIGSWRWLQDPQLRCNPGGKIQVTLSDPAQLLNASQAVNFAFEGADLYFMKGGEPVRDPMKYVSQLPRYFGIVNENILAPAWMSNEGIPFADAEYYVYSSVSPTDYPKATTWTLAAGAITAAPNPQPFEIPIDAGYEFYCRRVLVDLQLTSTAAAIVLAKVRTGGGYVVNDSYVDYAKYLCGSEYPGFWRVSGGDSVYIDTQLADYAGTGNVTYQIYLEGFRRRRQ